MSTSVVTPNFRVSYPKVFKPELNKLSKVSEYSVQAIFPKGTDLTPLKNAVKAACEKKWGADPKKWPKNMRSPFRKAEEKIYEDEATGKKVYPSGMEEGVIFTVLKAKAEKHKPKVLDQAKNEILVESDFYGGCYARALVNAYAYDQGGNCGVSFGLQHLQKVKDGDPFGSKVSAEEAFAPIEGADTSDDLFS